MKERRISARSTGEVLKRKKQSPRMLAARKTIRRRQQIHRRIALQPISILALMCIGVMLAAFTLNSLADSITVTATIPAPPLTQPAVIATPPDGYTTSTQALSVSGTCPNNSYVNLTDNGVFVGTETCTSSNAFQIGMDLSPGSNELLAQDYNITNSPGPTSPTITVTYSAPSPPPNNGGTSSTPPTTALNSPTPTAPITSAAVPSPIATPVDLVVTSVDLTIPYTSQNLTPVVSYQPTVSGIAPPYSYIVVVIHSDYYTCSTYANAQGYWSCTVPTTMPSGDHTVNVTAKTPQGQDLSYPPISIKVINAGPPTVTTPAPFHITASYDYSVQNVGQVVNYTIHMTGGDAPYAYTIDWGDGMTQTVVRQSPDDFVISHTYGWVDASLASKVIKVQAIDASGQAGTLQLDALIRNPAFHSVVANITNSTGLWGTFNDLRPWLWLIWPGYVIIVLLVISFWLGERQELAVLLGKKPKLPTKLRHHGAHR